jgi:hypothetical protein
MTTTSTTTSGITTSTRTGRAPTTQDVVRAAQHVQDGRLTRARLVLTDLWTALADGPAQTRCQWLRSSVAHWLAVAAADPAAELAWRDRAVEQALACNDRSMPFAGTGWTVGDMLPRLLLASAEAYARADQPCAAMEDLGRARTEVAAFPRGPARAQLRRELAAATYNVERRPAVPLRAVSPSAPRWVRLDPPADDD